MVYTPRNIWRLNLRCLNPLKDELAFYVRYSLLYYLWFPYNLSPWCFAGKAGPCLVAINSEVSLTRLHRCLLLHIQIFIWLYIRKSTNKRYKPIKKQEELQINDFELKCLTTTDHEMAPKNTKSRVHGKQIKISDKHNNNWMSG